jgi:ribonuclease VapC
MIVVDTSAIVAIALGERERQEFVRIIERAERVLVSTVSAAEARTVVQQSYRDCASS